MEDQDQLETGSARPAAEPVRSRWTPKPEQILILESIFNSGMVNPPKDETARIRKLLEKFGTVGDANVFYWFQNRRSRSRRRQRQIQAATLCGGSAAGEQLQAQPPGGLIQYQNSMTAGGAGFVCNPGSGYGAGSGLESGPSSSFCLGPGGCDGTGDILSFSGMQEYDQNSHFGNVEASDLCNFQSEGITVFINGVATEVGTGPLDLRGMFGGDFMLYHSSGVPVEVNQYGLLVQALQRGESYFLIPRNC